MDGMDDADLEAELAGLMSSDDESGAALRPGLPPG